MAESSSSGPRRHNRANWVALRTLRQLPKVVGETSAGEPIVEIKSVRLVLRDGAAHFSRVTTCSKCGREVPGAPVLNPGDLDHPAHPVICKDCVRTASAPVLSTRRARVDPDPGAAGSPGGGAAGGDDTRVAALERQVAELAELVKGQRADLEAAIEGRVEETRVEVRSFATKELARAQEDVDRMMKGVVERVGRSAGSGGEGASAVEARLTRTIERLTQQVDAQRAELLADFEGRLAGLRAPVEDQRGAGSSEIEALKAELAGTRDDLHRRIDAVAVPAGPDDTELQAGFEARVARLEEELVRAAGERDPDRRRLDALEARLAAEAARLEALLDERLARVAEDAASHGPRLEGLDAGLREVQATVEGARDAAARVGDQLVERAESAAADARRVKALDKQLRQLDERLEGSRAEAAGLEAQLIERLDRQAERVERAAAVVPRLDALEKQLEDTVGRLTALVESQRLEIEHDVRSGLDEVRAAVAAAQKGSDRRLGKVETAVAQRAAQLEDLVELQTALDTGLGELRSELEQVRDTAKRAAHIDSRLGSLVDVSQLPPVEPERGRRSGKKAADAVAGLSAALQGLLSDQRQLRAEVSTLGNESETAVRASARASAQAAAVGPLRQDVRGLRDEVVAQNEAVAALAKTVESLRRAVHSKPPTRPAAERAPKATKAPEATKATRATKAAKGTKTAKATKAVRATKKA